MTKRKPENELIRRRATSHAGRDARATPATAAPPRSHKKTEMSMPRYKGLSQAQLYQQALQATVVKSAASNERIVAQTPSLQKLEALLKRPIP